MKTITQLETVTDAAACSLRRGGSRKIWGQIVDDIESNRAQLFYVCNDSYLVLRMLPDELLILAASGSDAKMLMEICLQIAKLNGVEHVRFHTSKKGLPRLLAEFNPVEVSREYRINVNED